MAVGGFAPLTAPDPLDMPVLPLPAQLIDVPWPDEEWPTAEVPPGVELRTLMNDAFDPEGPLHQTYAVVIVHHGRLVFERYDGLLPQWDKPGKPVGRETPLLSWSVAKSMLHAVVGMLVAEGRLALDEPAPVPQWDNPGDPRRAINLQHLLDMRDGLDFTEDYVDADASDVLQMLFGEGRHDMAAFAADRPLATGPGTRFNYSSGTSNVISGIVAREVGPGEPYRRFLADRLFGPLRMASATATFDDAGTWVAASYAYASCPRVGSMAGAGPGPSTPRTVICTDRTGGRGTTPTAPSGPPVTRASSSMSVRRSISWWSAWGGPIPSTGST